MSRELREAAERDLLRVWRALAAGRADPAAGVQEAGGLLLASTGVPFAFFNGAFASPGCDAATAHGTAEAFFAARALPYLFRVSPDAPEVAAALDQAGLAETPPLELMGMAAPERTPPLPPGLAVERADTPERLGRHAALLAASFNLPVEIMVGFLGDVPLRDRRFLAFNGLLDGEPVATTAVFVQDGVAGIYDVATLPHRRGQGLGEAMTWHAVREGAARGAGVAVLQPSPMGRPVYERMGFGVVAQWRQFTRG